MDIIKVSSKSISQKVAGSIANSFREGCTSVEVQTVGAGAVNQAIKAISIARGYVAPLGMNLITPFSEATFMAEPSILFNPKSPPVLRATTSSSFGFISSLL